MKLHTGDYIRYIRMCKGGDQPERLSSNRNSGLVRNEASRRECVCVCVRCIERERERER